MMWSLAQSDSRSTTLLIGHSLTNMPLRLSYWSRMGQACIMQDQSGYHQAMTLARMTMNRTLSMPLQHHEEHATYLP